MEPTTIIIILFLVLIIGGIISKFQKSKKLSQDPTQQRIEMLEEENYPLVTQGYKLEGLDNLRSHWLENGIKISASQFQGLYKISIQDKDGNFSFSKRLTPI